MPFVNSLKVTREEDAPTKILTFFQAVVTAPTGKLSREEEAGIEHPFSSQIWFIPRTPDQREILVIGIPDSEVSEAMESLPVGANFEFNSNLLPENLKPKSDDIAFVAVKGREAISNVLHTIGQNTLGRGIVGDGLASKAQEIALRM